MFSVYVETTIPSYLVARTSDDLILRGRQQLTREWWEHARARYRLVISDPVLDEIGQGDTLMAAKRRQIVDGLEILQVTDSVEQLHEHYLHHLGLPVVAGVDALHLALAVAYEVDYLLTWNLKHIANGHVIRRLTRLNESLGIETPVIVTPDELMEPDPGGEA